MDRSARNRASSSPQPAATSSSICRSRWKRNSSLSSCSTALREKTDRSRRRTMLAQRIAISQSDCPDNQRNRRGQTFPLRGFQLQNLSSGRCQLIVFGPPIVLAVSPFRANPAILFELVQSWIQRALAYLENVAGHLPDALRNRPSVHRLKRDCFQNQQVECALHEIGWLAHSVSPQ